MRVSILLLSVTLLTARPLLARAQSSSSVTEAMSSIFGGGGTPEPKYTVIKTGDGYEVRKYPPQLRAVTKMEDNSSAFRKIAGYIFGGNTVRGSDKNEKIAMTAPVAMSVAHKGEKIAMTAPVAMDGTTMAFIMPDKYKSVSDLPVPKSSEVQLIEVPEVQYAVIRFSWWWDETNVRKHEDTLRETATREGLSLSANQGDVQMWAYNPPWTLPMFRRNEVAIPPTKPL